MNLNHRSKYSAVAAAVALACAVGANSNVDAASAIPTAGDTLTIGQQFIAAASSTLGQNVTVGVSIGADYVSGDRVRLQIAGADFLTSGSIGQPTGTAAAGTCTLSIIGFADANTANFRVPASGMANGTPCVFTLPVKVSSVASAGATVTFASFFSTGEALEASVSRTSVKTADQFSAAVVKTLAGQVDVEAARYHFTSEDTQSSSLLTGNESQLVLTIGNATAAVPNGVAKVAAVTVNVTGDFTWLDDESSGFGTCTAGDATGGNARAVASQAVGVANAAALNCGTLTYVISGGSAGELTSGLVTIALGKNNTVGSSVGTYDRTIPAPTDYSTSVSFTYYNTSSSVTGTSTELAAADANAGSFTLNGSTIYVPFLPYNSSTSRVVYLTNRSDQTGSVSATAVADGSNVECPSFTVATAKAGGVTLLTSGIDAGIRACYGADFDGKVALTIVSNIPGGKAEIFSAYNRNGSLTAVSNSSNGRDSTNTRD